MHFFKKSMFPPLRTKPYYSKPKWRSRRPKSPQMRKSAQFHFLRKNHLLAPKVRFGHFLHFWALFEFLAPNDQKRHQETVTPTSFWAVGPKKWFLSAKMQKKAKLCSKFTFLVNLIKFHYFCGISGFCTLWGPMLKTHKNLVVYWSFWDPKTQKCDFSPNLAKSRSFCGIPPKRARILHLR